MHVQPAPVLIVLEGPPGTTEKQKSGRSEKNATTTEKQKTTVPEQREKNVPVKDFVPTEKIRADKAVDFPADIQKGFRQQEEMTKIKNLNHEAHEEARRKKQDT